MKKMEVKMKLLQNSLQFHQDVHLGLVVWSFLVCLVILDDNFDLIFISDKLYD